MPDLPAGFVDIALAHRGLHDRSRRIVENSRAAVRAAVAQGYGIEIDVQESLCGEAMVFHDEALPRLTEASGLVSEWTAAALGRVRLKGSEETIPTLVEILELVAGRVPLLVEIKDQTGVLGPDVGRLEARVAACLRDATGPVAVMSFNPHSVEAVAARAPLIPRGLTSCDFSDGDWSLPDYRRAELGGLADADRLGAAFVSHDHRDLANPALLRLKARGLAILCWTVRSEAEERAARRVADNITFEGYLPEKASRA